MNPILVTGASGFVGSHLSPLIPIAPFKGNLLDITNLKLQIEEIRPQSVIHLAAQSHVGSSYQNPRLTYEVNFWGTYNLLEALRAAGFKGRFLYVSSADVYGKAQNLPVKETHPTEPLSPYAVSKRAAELLCLQEKSFDVIIARPFNHIGPGQNAAFALPSFIKQLKAIQKGEQEPVLSVGSLESTRDFCDVRDIAKGYEALLAKGQPGEIYNLCSGQEYRMKDILEQLMLLSGITAQVRQDPALMRPGEQMRMLGSFEKIYENIGWQPKISLAESLKDIWEQS